MPAPTAKDVSIHGATAEEKWRAQPDWCLAPLAEVQANMDSTGYPTDRITLVQGMVEETIPSAAPDRIAVLRLDTDWYESTYHELVHLFPRLVDGGVLIIDDYGHWKVSQEATDRYLEETGVKMMLHRVDYTARIGIRAGS